MKNVPTAIVCLLCVVPLLEQSGNTTYYNQNGSYGGNSQSTTFGNQTTTTHYGANGAPAGTSVTTKFGNQTTTTHYNQYGQPAGTTTRYNNTEER